MSDVSTAIGPLILALIVASRLMRSSATATGQRVAPAPRYDGLRQRFGTGRIFRLVVWLVLLSAVVGFGPSSIVYTGWLGLFLVPWTRWAFVPLGRVRLSVWMMSIDSRVGPADRTQQAAMFGSLALLHRPTHDPRLETWLVRKLDRALQHDELGGAGVAAFAFLAGSRGEMDRARGLLRSVFLLPPGAVCPSARALAECWLLADADARGALYEMAGLRPRWTSRLASLREHALGSAPRTLRWRLALLRRWIWAPSRLVMFSLMRRAWAESPVTLPAPPAPRAPVAEQGSDVIAGALRAHSNLVAEHDGARRWDTIGAAFDGWDRAFGEGLIEAKLKERDGALGTRNAESALGAIREQVVNALLEAAERAHILIAVRPEAAVALEVAGRQRERAFASLHEFVVGVERQRQDPPGVRPPVPRRGKKKGGNGLPPLDQWINWLRFLSTYRALAMRPHDRMAAFQEVATTLTDHGAWLFNVRGERPMANAMFEWLSSEAGALGWEELRALNANNAQISGS